MMHLAAIVDDAPLLAAAGRGVMAGNETSKTKAQLFHLFPTPVWCPVAEAETIGRLMLLRTKATLLFSGCLLGDVHYGRLTLLLHTLILWL